MTDLYIRYPGAVTNIPAGAFPLRAPDGSASAPSYSFTNGTNYGMYFATNSLRFATAGTLALSIDNTQNALFAANLAVTGTTTLATALTGVVHAVSGVLSASSVVNADVSASAAIAFSKLAALTSANILVGSVGNVATAVAVTGDVLIDNAGVTSINTGVIVNADVNASAAIAYSKLNLAASIATGDLASGLVVPSNKGGTGVANNASSTLTISGAFGTTLTVSNTTALTLPTNGTVVSTQATGSSVALNVGNNWGSSNTCIRRFTNSVVSGSDITYADSATLGMSCTITQAGVYSITYTDERVNDTTKIGISLNSAQLTTSIESITTANRLIMTRVNATVAGVTQVNCSWTGRLAVNDVIRAHGDGAGGYSTTASIQFVINQLFRL